MIAIAIVLLSAASAHCDWPDGDSRPNSGAGWIVASPPTSCYRYTPSAPSHHVPPDQPISKRTVPMKRALLAAALLLAASFNTARAADEGVDGQHDLLKHCSESALSGGTYRDPWRRAYCLGFVTKATNLSLNSGDRICLPKQGINYAIMTELFARYLINHPEKRDSLGVTLVTDMLQEAY